MTSVQRYPLEMPLFLFSLLISLPIWGAFIALLVISVMGIFYLSIYALIIFIGHLYAISYIRGNGIKVTEKQLPELFAVFKESCEKLKIKKMPEMYIIQGNGVLNALAIKFLFNKIVVIYSNLIEECEEQPGAIKMVVGHELGHIRAGHLRWKWLIWPSFIVPFLGKALSRAQEYTADRYGLYCVQNQQDACKGLMLLAGGKNTTAKTCLQTFVDQTKNINTGFMRIGEWMQTHPPLVRRIAALIPELKQQRNYFATIKAILFLAVSFCFLILVLVGIYMFLSKTPSHQETNESPKFTVNSDYFKNAVDNIKLTK